MYSHITGNTQIHQMKRKSQKLRLIKFYYVSNFPGDKRKKLASKLPNNKYLLYLIPGSAITLNHNRCTTCNSC